MQPWNLAGYAAEEKTTQRPATEPRQPGRGSAGPARLLARAGTLAAVLLAAGCATPGAPPVADGPGSPAQRELAAGIERFDKGEYVAAIRTLLTSDEIWRASLQTRVTAQKYVAFSHCLSNRPLPCKQSFSDLLRMKPDFELAAAEAGHPQWGAAFRQAKAEAAGGLAAPSAEPASRTLARASDSSQRGATGLTVSSSKAP